jgi:hypothetical protein
MVSQSSRVFSLTALGEVSVCIFYWNLAYPA